MSFGISFIVLAMGVLLLLFLLVAVPVALVALLASPDARRVCKRAAVAIAPLAVVGLGLLTLVGYSSTERLVATPSTLAPPQPPLVPAVADDAPAPMAAEFPLPPVAPPSPPQPGRGGSHALAIDAVPTWGFLALSSLCVCGAIFGVVFATRSGRWHISVVGLGLLVPAGLMLLALLYPGRPVEIVNHQQAQQAHLSADQRHSAAEHERRLLEELLLRQQSGGAIPVEEDLAAKPPTVSPASLEKPVSITEFRRGDTQGRRVAELPDWVEAQAAAGPPQEPRLVLTSRRYATVAEAEAELLESLRPQVQNFLRETGLAVDAQTLTRHDMDLAGAIVGRVEEQFLVDLGSSQEPVYRVTWQVQLNPQVRAIVWGRSREAQRDARLLQLAAGVGLLTLIFGAWAAYFRLDDATQGRYRGRLQLAAAGVSLAGLAVISLA